MPTYTPYNREMVGTHSTAGGHRGWRGKAQGADEQPHVPGLKTPLQTQKNRKRSSPLQHPTTRTEPKKDRLRFTMGAPLCHQTFGFHKKHRPALRRWHDTSRTEWLVSARMLEFTSAFLLHMDAFSTTFPFGGICTISINLLLRTDTCDRVLARSTRFVTKGGVGYGVDETQKAW